MNRPIGSSVPLPHGWSALRTEEPRLRTRQIAQRLGVSEGELIDALVGGSVTRLRGPWVDLLKALEPIGVVMGLTRNEVCVIEKDGRYQNIQDFGAMGQVLDRGIDLRLFLNRWGSAYLVRDDETYGLRPSIQFFDVHGEAVHKVFLREESDREAFHALAHLHSDPDQEPGLVVDPPEDAPAATPDQEVDVDGLREAWLSLQDTHDFHRLLRRFGVEREQAFRLVGSDLAWPVGNRAHRRILEGAAAGELPIMIFVGNPGVVQIHSGRVHTLKEVGPWYNVLDPEFNLHLDEQGVANSWVVRKPTAQGVVTALELYDEEGRQVALFTGKRKEEESGENPAWRALVEGAS